MVGGVSTAIELDDETRFPAKEVHEVTGGCLLAAEFQAVEASPTQASPERGLGMRLILAKLA